MNFDEWMAISQVVLGQDAMDVANQFFLDNIDFDTCIKQMYKVMPDENKVLFTKFMERLENNKSTI